MKQPANAHSSLFCGLLALLAIAACATVPAYAGTTTCSTNSEIRQLDYWLGTWTVTPSGGTDASTARVSLSLDRCLFTENWDNGKGHAGKDMFAYSPDDKNWHGMFADNEGRVHLFDHGKVAAGSAEFQGPSRGPQGEAVLNRVKLVRLSLNKLEQTWEKSTDNGATWSTIFRGEYARKTP